MADKWDKISLDHKSILGMVSGIKEKEDKTKGWWLDFSKWFEYQNTDLNSIHNSPKEIKNLNDEKVAKFLWEDLSTYKLNDKEMDEFIDWLSLEQTNVASNLINQGFSNEAMVAYINNWDTWADPFAQWTWMFEKKTDIKETWTNREPYAWGIWLPTSIFWWLELWWMELEKMGESKLRKYIRPTPNDVKKMYKDPWNAWIYEDVTKALEEQAKKIENMKAAWASAEEIAAEQEVYDVMKKSGERYNLNPRETTVDVAIDEWIAWNELEMTEQAYRKARTKWITKVEPEIVRSRAKFNPVTDVLDALTEDSFNVTRDAWIKDYEPALNELKEIYAQEWEMSLMDLQKWRNKIKETKKFAETWEEVKSVSQNIDDHIDRKLWDIIWDTLEKEHPWQWLKQEVERYWNLQDFEKTHAKRATTELTKAPKKSAWSYEKRVQNAATKVWDKITWTDDIKRQTKRGQWMKKIGHNMRPSTWIEKLKPIFKSAWVDEKTIDSAINVVSKSEKITWKVAPKVLRKMLGVMGAVAAPLEAIWSLNFIDSHAEEYSIIPYLEEKKRWKHWNPSEETKWWTEEDWKNVGLWEEDIWEILQSPWFREVSDKISWGGDTLINQYIELANYDPIKNLWD